MCICKIAGCDKPISTNNYCHGHYEGFRVGRHICAKDGCINMTALDAYCRKHSSPKICKIEGCEKKHEARGYCKTHRNAIYSIYPNPGLLQRNRLKKLNSINWICEDCGGLANQIHHIDGSRDNHALENLKGLCNKCHMGNYHNAPRGPLKGNKEYSKRQLQRFAKRKKRKSFCQLIRNIIIIKEATQ